MSNVKPKTQSMVSVPHVQDMLEEALFLVQYEITKLKTKSMSGRSLDSREAKVLQGYIKSLVDIDKSQREAQKEADLSKISTEELVALLGDKLPKQIAGKVDSGS